MRSLTRQRWCPISASHATVFDPEALAELVGSIKEIGVLQPIVVRRNPDGPGFELIMGERRLRATREAGLNEIPAIIRSTEDTAMLRDALVENLHRSQLNPLEEAAAYQQLLDDFEITHEQLAARLSRSRPQISNTLRLLKLPPAVQKRVAAGVLSAGHARALLTLPSSDAMDQLATRIVAEGMSVRATEEAVTLGVEVKTPKKGSVRPGGRTAALDDLSARLGDHLDTRVGVQLGRAKGKITIDFATVEDLDRIVHLISPTDPGVFGRNRPADAGKAAVRAARKATGGHVNRGASQGRGKARHGPLRRLPVEASAGSGARGRAASP